MKIYTKTGDGGWTSLFGGKRVNKDSLRVEACGKCDELNSQIGVIVSENPPAEIEKKLLRIQQEIFVLGADLATPFSVDIKVPRIKKSFVSRLERDIDLMEKDLPKLKNFILPGGGKIGASLHLARSAARCLERILVTLGRQDKLNPRIFPFINRLSDWFFVLARHANQAQNFREVPWSGRA